MLAALKTRMFTASNGFEQANSSIARARQIGLAFESSGDSWNRPIHPFSLMWIKIDVCGQE
jgi:hypothetical protein